MALGKVDPRSLLAVETLLMRGMTPEIVATLTGLSRRTIYRIRNRVEEEFESAGEENVFENYEMTHFLHCHPGELFDEQETA